MSLFSKRFHENYYDEWEILPEDQRHILKRQKLLDYLFFAREHSAFYQTRLEPMSEASENPIARVKPLLAEDLRKNVPPVGKLLVTHLERDGYSVFQSGGTTGIPKTSLFSHEELEGLNFCNARGFVAVGLTDKDRVANLWASGSLYMTFIHMNRMLQQYGCMNFPFTNHTAKDFVHTVMSLFNVNCVSGVGSIVLTFLREIYELGATNLKIDKIYFGAEHFYEADKRELREKFGVETILAPGYGTVDSWYLGYQCKSCDTGVFHVHDDQVFMEILHEHTLTPCQTNEAGMVYVTAFARKLTPIIRYRVGDRAKWLSGQCACGRTTPRFHLLGRGDDVLRIAYDSIDYAAIQELVQEIEGCSGTVQMQKYRREGLDELVIRIESETDASNYPKVIRNIENAFYEARPAYRDFIAKKLTWPLRVELTKIGTLKTNVRTGKLIRVIDWEPA